MRAPERGFAIGLALEGETPLFDKIEEFAVTSISTMRQRPTKSLAKPAPWPSAVFRDQLGQPHQSVGGGNEGKGPCDAITATEAGLLLSPRLS